MNIVRLIKSVTRLLPLPIELQCAQRFLFD